MELDERIRHHLMQLRDLLLHAEPSAYVDSAEISLDDFEVAASKIVFPK